MHHRFPVFQHVGDAGRGAAIVFQHVEFILGDAHDVDADDVGIDAARRIDAHHLRHEGGVLDDDVCRDAPCPQDFLTVIDVVDEGVERPHPLFDAGRKPAPFRGRKHPGNDVEGDEAFGGFVVAIDGEGDALAAETALGLAVARSTSLRS